MSSESENGDTSDEAGAEDDQLSPFQLKQKYGELVTQRTRTEEDINSALDNDNRGKGTLDHPLRRKRVPPQPDVIGQDFADTVEEYQSHDSLLDDDESVDMDSGTSSEDKGSSNSDEASEDESSASEDGYDLRALIEGPAPPVVNEEFLEESALVTPTRVENAHPEDLRPDGYTTKPDHEEEKHATRLNGYDTMEIDHPQTPKSLPNPTFHNDSVPSSKDVLVIGKQGSNQTHSTPMHEVRNEHSEEEWDEVSLVPNGMPDAVQTQTPSASSMEATYVELQQNAEGLASSKEFAALTASNHEVPSEGTKVTATSRSFTKEAQSLSVMDSQPERPCKIEGAQSEQQLKTSLSPPNNVHIAIKDIPDGVLDATTTDFDKQVDQVTANPNDAKISMAFAEDNQVITPADSTIVQDPTIPVPSLLKATLRVYQHKGLDWLAGLYASRESDGGILAGNFITSSPPLKY